MIRLPVAIVLAATAVAEAQTFHVIEALAPDGQSRVFGISPDGTWASGYSDGPQGSVAFRWSVAGGREDIGLGPGFPTHSGAGGISATGQVLVGSGRNANQNFSRPFRWSQSTGYQSIPAPPPYNLAFFTAVSADGAIASGIARNGPAAQVLRWTEAGGTQLIPRLNDTHPGIQQHGMSRDGAVIVAATTGLFDNRAVRWTAATGTVELPGLPGSTSTGTFGTNHDGSISVGRSSQMPMMWTGFTPIPLQVGTGYLGGELYAVNDAGTIAAGIVGVPRGSFVDNVAGVWTPGTGLIRLTDYLALNGVSVPAGYTPGVCTGISADGNTITGYTIGPGPFRGFVVTIPAPWAAPLLGLLFAAHRRRR